jgi:putative aldouronate transport system permease protein
VGLLPKRKNNLTISTASAAIDLNTRGRGWKRFYKSRYLYIMFIPTLVYLIIFKFAPMFGLVIAFKDYSIIRGFAESPWVGFKHFKAFFSSVFFWRIIRNTFALNIFDVVFGFPVPIILSLMLNEVYVKPYKRVIQSVSYLPHFISMVIVVSMFKQFLSPSMGLVNNVLADMGFERIYFLGEPKYFWPLYTILHIWKESGWGTILYLAAMTGINSQLYEAATIDGAGKWRQAWHITLPGITTTIIILYLLKIGRMLEVNFEAILLLYSPSIYETSDVLATFVYRRGIRGAQFDYATAVGLFQAVVGFVMIATANTLSRKYSETSLW